MTATIVNLRQGTPEWHEHRRKYRNASETPTVVGVSPWQTRYELWLLRTGRAKSKVTPAMAHGAALEGAARDAYERLTGLVLEPLVLVDGEYSASLDGITLDGDLIVEIKCPVRGRRSELWQAAVEKKLPENYFWQLQHQLMVAGAERAHLFIFDGQEGVMVEQAPKPECWQTLKRDWDAFMEHLSSDSPPPLSEADTRERDDEAWRLAAGAYIEAKRLADEAGVKLDQAKTALVGLGTHPSEAGAGICVTRYWKRGSVDYKKISELKGVDLERYRGPTREEVRVAVGKI